MEYYKIDADAVTAMPLKEAARRILFAKGIEIKQGKKVAEASRYIPYGKQEQHLLVEIDIYVEPSYENLYHGGWFCESEPTFSMEEIRRVIPSVIGWGRDGNTDVLICAK